MSFKLNFAIFFVTLFLCLVQLGLAEDNAKWPIDFEQNSKTLPSIEVKLSPPENPLPQVAAEIKLLESSRMKLEEEMMQKLENEYNKALSNSKIKIKETVEKSLSIFNDHNILGHVISNSVKILKKDNLRKVKEETDEQSYLKDVRRSEGKNGPLPPPELRSHVSFIEQNNIIRNIPSVKISVSEIVEPDVSIKDKIEEIEQYRTDEEVMMFEIAISEFHALTDITILELEKQIQLQLNPFLVDTKVVHRSLEKELKELEKREETQKTKEQIQKHKQSSFIEQDENDDSGNILNVKISQSDNSYPTVDELVMQMQKKRDITERLERNKILDLQMKLLKAQSEMIKDALHFSVSKVISQYSPIVETIKLQAMKML